MHEKEKKEVKRIENFSSGKIKCIVCGEEHDLYFNGGKLDYVMCCGHLYQTEHAQIDLVIYKLENAPKMPR